MEPKTFDYQAVEKLHAEGNATVEAIEAITGPLAVNEELKALDAQGDLCTIVNTGSEIHYIHRSNREEGQAGVVEFKVPLVVNNEEPAQEEVESVE